jgi:hypothetical protein
LPARTKAGQPRDRDHDGGAEKFLGDSFLNPPRGYGTVRPRRIRAITGELRAMARMEAWL